MRVFSTLGYIKHGTEQVFTYFSFLHHLDAAPGVEVEFGAALFGVIAQGHVLVKQQRVRDLVSLALPTGPWFLTVKTRVRQHPSIHNIDYTSLVYQNWYIIQDF